ncbi:MerR family transcriptional regulator [Ruminococcus sp. AF42-9BH]|jgi:MerR family transcriptional regulator, copper efflux regulator|nr:MerR family transcriptional regulator [uncultured Blautia sp.]RHO83733.1 MerR family transcriptional regulator [Ruminococcus sp. AF42-9BH]
MKIKQVEELVGITRKNIRFYEEQGLLNVERAENGYREYHTADIARLQEIKLFRKMDISIEEMRALFEKRKSLQFCLEQHLGELERRREGLVKMQEMCERLIAEHQSLDTLNAENCLEEIEQMEKEGARFMDIKKTDIRKKRRTGAIIGAVVMILFMGFVIGLMLWANTQDPIPTGLLIFLIAIPVVIIGGILAALAGRMKEIEGGEEDEASKY